MASLSELAKQKAKLLEQAPEQLATEANRIQRELWKNLVPLLESLEVDSEGNITQSQRNVNKISAIINSLNVLLAGEEYRNAVSDFISNIDKGVTLTNEIAENIKRGFQPNAAQTALTNLVKNNALNSLLGDGLRGAVSRPFAEQLISNVSTRTPLREAIKNLQVIIEGDKTTDGRIEANIKTVATTSQAVADRAYSTAVYEDLGIEFFEYVGGEIETTRPFCEHRIGKVFHKREIQQWGEGKNSGGLNDIKNGTWNGRIRETNENSIFTNLGGWNCRHSLVPVIGSFVPKEVRERAKKEGFI